VKTDQPLLIVVAGPTGSGKTAFSLNLSEATGASIISADARQIYRELKIGSAAPAAHELEKVPHYFVGTHGIQETFSAGMFARQARQLLEEKLFHQHPVQIVCGGSGLYIQALLHGMDELPEVDPAIRERLMKTFHAEGLAVLLDELEKKDPEYFSKVDQSNPQRIIRALEIIRSSGIPFSVQLGKKKPERSFRTLILGMDLPRQELYDRINQRTLQMIGQGWIDEARGLIPFKHLNALQTVGYKELFEHFEGKRGLEETIALISQNTRRYAKRQLTWLRNRETLRWIHPESKVEDVLTLF
jgi:tRNA dimethylallyltransferase